MTQRIRVYVAGAYNAMSVLDVLDNMRRAMVLDKDLILAGFAPYCPHHDYHRQLQLQEGEKLVVADYYETGLAWLEVANAVLGPWYELKSLSITGTHPLALEGLMNTEISSGIFEAKTKIGLSK